MRRAVIVSPNPESSAGGVERMCALLSRVLDDEGWEVKIVGPQRGMKRWQFHIGAGYLGLSRSAMQAALREAPDLIVTNGLLGMGRRSTVPRVHVYHGTMLGDTRAEGDSLSRRERVRRIAGGCASEAVAGRGATVVSVSEQAAAEVRRLYRVRTDAVIPNGVDTDVFRPRPRLQARERFELAPDGRYCLFVGRMQHRKGAELLMPACRAAGFGLLIAGATGAPGATHLGVLGPDALADAYSAADCVLFPSRYEACSYVVLEALACAAPLLTSTVGWMPTFLRSVPEYARLCVRPEHQDIVDRLGELGAMDTDGLAQRAARWVAENNSLERYAERWRDLLAGLS
jgi:glycosyltransferase involved in cell wall biosynthesis